MRRISEWFGLLLFVIMASGPQGFASVSWLVRHNYLLLVAAGLMIGILAWLIYLLIVEVRRERRVS